MAKLLTVAADLGKQAFRNLTTAVIVVAVAWMLSSHAIGFLNGTFSLRRVVGALGVSILLFGGFFGILHPDRDGVSIPAALIAVLIGFTLWVLSHLLALEHVYANAGISAIVLIWTVGIPAVWAWYGIIELDGYDPLETVVDVAPEPIAERIEEIADSFGLRVGTEREEDPGDKERRIGD
ncbi:hypothetical protein [Halalkalicoccus jeotgali]|nr:hypothetical protein [Halalkalicoccus jeotgali]